MITKSTTQPTAEQRMDDYRAKRAVSMMLDDIPEGYHINAAMDAIRMLTPSELEAVIRFAQAQQCEQDGMWEQFEKEPF